MGIAGPAHQGEVGRSRLLAARRYRRYGQRYFSIDFGRPDHARIAEAFGLKGRRVEDPIDLDAAIRAADALDEAAAPVSRWMG